MNSIYLSITYKIIIPIRFIDDTKFIHKLLYLKNNNLTSSNEKEIYLT